MPCEWWFVQLLLQIMVILSLLESDVSFLTVPLALQPNTAVLLGRQLPAFIPEVGRK